MNCQKLRSSANQHFRGHYDQTQKRKRYKKKYKRVGQLIKIMSALATFGRSILFLQTPMARSWEILELQGGQPSLRAPLVKASQKMSADWINGLDIYIYILNIIDAMEKMQRKTIVSGFCQMLQAFEYHPCSQWKADKCHGPEMSQNMRWARGGACRGEEASPSPTCFLAIPLITLQPSASPLYPIWKRSNEINSQQGVSGVMINWWGSLNLSIEIAHLLSIKLVAESSVAGQANAETSVLSTVIMAPCFIRPMVRPEEWRGAWRYSTSQTNPSIVKKPHSSYLMWASPGLQCSQQSSSWTPTVRHT